MKFTIIPARQSDAPLIANGIIEAVGHEIAAEFAGSPERLPLVHQTFTELASREDSQYSYLNTLVALADNGEVAGILVAYDGGRLQQLRKAFIEVANRTLGFDIKEEEMIDETSPDEIYLDSLCVFDKYRRQGLARQLIEATADKFKTSGKPLGLLVDYDNPNARKLYASLGFESQGERPFAGTMMEHMQKPL